MKDGTLRLCQDYRALNRVLVDDTVGLGNIESIFDQLRGKRYFTPIDMASGFRDGDGLLWEANRAGFGLKCLPSVFAHHVGLTLGDLESQRVENWLDDSPLILLYLGGVIQLRSS